MNENINLCEILKDCPKGTKFYSYVHGEVEFYHIDPSLSHPIVVEARTKRNTKLDKTFSKKGYYDSDYNGICTLVPSLEQPDWSKWKCPKPKFDPKNLKPFDRVLVRDTLTWECSFFNRQLKNPYPNRIGRTLTATGGSYSYCIPYNDETKHLVGTTDEAPEYYRYWEE